jgi:hypothetical protein
VILSHVLNLNFSALLIGGCFRDLLFSRETVGRRPNFPPPRLLQAQQKADCKLPAKINVPLSDYPMNNRNNKINFDNKANR